MKPKPQDNVIDLATAATPHNEQAETAAMSIILQNPKALERWTWPESLFFSQPNRILLAAAKRCHEAGALGDYFAVVAELQRKNELDAVGGDARVMDVFTASASGSIELLHHFRALLVEAARYRSALAVATEAAESFRRGEGSVVDVADALAGIATSDSAPEQTLGDVIRELVDDLERKEPPEAFSTGLRLLDQATDGGPKRGELTTVAAETSGGKSILLAQLAVRAIQDGHAVAFFSLEMPAKSVVKRMISNMTGAAVRPVRDGVMQKELAAFTSAVGALQRSRLHVVSDSTDWEAIEGKARELVAHGECDVAIVDYLQLVHLREMARNETREQLVSEVARRLKSLALNLNIAVITASQLNEEGKLRESRSIGHHSDHVWTIRHPNDGSVLSLDKNRNGERGVVVPVLMSGSTSQLLPRDPRP